MPQLFTKQHSYSFCVVQYKARAKLRVGITDEPTVQLKFANFELLNTNFGGFVTFSPYILALRPSLCYCNAMVCPCVLVFLYLYSIAYIILLIH